MFLLDDILLAPLKGIVWMGRKIQEIVDREVSDEGKVKEELMALQLRFEMDEISEEEYTKKEEQLLDRLEAIRKAKEGR